MRTFLSNPLPDDHSFTFSAMILINIITIVIYSTFLKFYDYLGIMVTIKFMFGCTKLILLLSTTTQVKQTSYLF